MSKRPKSTTPAIQAKNTATTAAPAKQPPSRDKTSAGHRTARSSASAENEKAATRGSSRKADAAAVASSHTTPAQPRRPRAGGLTAAAALLTKTGKSMKCGPLAEALIASGAWKPSGKTPAATLASAIFREIKAKGADARFKKVAPGTFAAN